MKTKSDKSINDLVEQYLGKRLPEDMAITLSMSMLPTDAQDFIIRMLTLMKRAEYSATGFNPHLIRWLSTIVPSVLPRAWEGRIPPLTMPGRHNNLDIYVAKLKKRSAIATPVFVDVGCGFPPVTSTDTSRKLEGWHIYGVDRSFADYILYDIDGHYACFDQEGIFQYFQALRNVSGRALYANPEATKNRFKELFVDLFPLLQNTYDTKSETVTKNGNRLIHNHILDFETDNLTFIKSDLTKLQLSSIKVIRCMNVLIYFEPEISKKMLLQAVELLEDDGIIIAGTNGLNSQSRYAVYKKNTDGLFMDEFAFSLDNLGHLVFMPFFTIHENDPEAMLLAKLVGTIRANESFGPEFNNRQDELLKQYGICQRRVSGFLHFPDEEMSPMSPVYLEKTALLWQQMTEEGYLDRAVKVLEQAGYDALKNSVGDIAIKPSESWLEK